MHIELIPLEKAVIDDKEIYLNSSKEEVLEILGKPEDVKDRYYYYDFELALDFDDDDRLEFIEFLGGHDSKLRPYIYGVSVFDTECDELIEILTENNDDEIEDNEDDSYGFLNISVGVWKEDSEDDYFTTIGIGVEDYYI